MPPRKVDSYLNFIGKTPEYADLFSIARQMYKNQATFLRLLPAQLAQHCSVGRIKDGRLTVVTENGAIAAKLKQISPSLLHKLQQRGWEVTAFQILVQAQNTAINSQPLEKHKPYKNGLELSQTGKDCLSKLAATLPNSDLKRAIDSLLIKQKNTSNKPDQTDR